MGLSLKECISRLKEVYPDLYPTHYAFYNGMYLFNALPRGVNKDKAVSDFHIVNPNDGGVSGSIPLNMIMHDRDAVNALKNAHEVDYEDQKIEHGIKIRSPYSGNTGSGHYYGITRTHEYLEHHGIPGMHWGEKNGPPYPLDAKTHKKVINRATNINTDGPKGMDPLTAYYAAEAIGIAAFCIGTSIYASIKRRKNHIKFKEQNDAISKEYLSDIALVDSFSEDSKPREIKQEHSREDDMAAVNPTYGQAIKGNTNNCVLCSISYDLRRRGYDVTAKLCDTGMYTEKVVKEMYKGAKEEDMGSYSWAAVTRKFEKKYPEGSRGIISINSIFGGHAMAFEIQNGKLEIYDAQSAEKRKLTDNDLVLYDPRYTQAVRLDNKQINWESANIACAELKTNWKSTIEKKRKAAASDKEASSVASEKVAAGVRSQINVRQIREYKKEHPGTKLSDAEILKNIYNK